MIIGDPITARKVGVVVIKMFNLYLDKFPPVVDVIKLFWN